MQALLLAHLLSDFALQSDWMIRAKQRGPWGVAPHIAVVAVLTLAAILPTLGQWWPAAALVVVAHAAIDTGKIAIDRRFPRYSLLLFYLDQALHALTLVAATLLVAGRLDADPWGRSGLFWAVALSVIAVTFVLAIVLRVSLPHFRFASRWWGVIERGVVLAVALGGSPALAPIAPLARLLLSHQSGYPLSRGDRFELVAGSLLALAVGVVLRRQIL